MKKHTLILTSLCLLFLSSCATYHISTESLMKQFAESGQEKKITVLIVPPYFFFPGIVRGNDLKTIFVLDKRQRGHNIRVTRHTGVKITQESGKKTTFYFDTLLLNDSTITGSKTHFFTANIRPIKFENITKIEIQK